MKIKFWEAGSLSKIVANLVSWLRRLFNWNRLKCSEIFNSVEVDNADSQHKQILIKEWYTYDVHFHKGEVKMTC